MYFGLSKSSILRKPFKERHFTLYFIRQYQVFVYNLPSFSGDCSSLEAGFSSPMLYMKLFYSSKEKLDKKCKFFVRKQDDRNDA
jgi:hypothetical protein